MNALADETVLWLHRDRAELLVRAADAFREVRDPGTLGLAAGQQRAVEGLLGLASDGSAGCGLLTAPAGLGKTLVRTSLQRQLAPARCATVVVESGLLDFDDLLLEVLSQLRGERVMPAQLPGRYERLAELKSALVSEVVATGRHLVLLLDDADRASTATLDAVGALMNLSSDRHTFVVPVLFGQPSLRQSLARLPALRQRVGAQFTLQALDAAESRASSTSCAGSRSGAQRNTAAALPRTSTSTPGAHCSSTAARLHPPSTWASRHEGTAT